MQSRWCRAWSRPNLTDFVHISSKKSYLKCVFVHWRDLGTKCKSTACLLENWNSSTTVPEALFSPWPGGHRRCPRIAFAVRPGRASAALLLWVPAIFPRTHAWKITLFAARGLLMSAQHCLVFVLGFQCWRVDSQGDESKLRSIEVRVRGPTLPATRSNYQVGYGDNRV